MSEPSYIGIDSNEHNEWVAALWVDGKIILSRPFKNTSPEIGALVRFITEHCTRPRICLKPASPTTLKLIKFIGGIPDVEVVLLSDAGLQMHQAWLPKGAAKTAARGNCQAQLLACCAERII